MTVRVRIGKEVRDLKEVDESWVNQRINRMRSDQLEPCVQVTFDEPDARFTLSTPSCVGGGAGLGRPVSAKERGLLELWNKLHLGTDTFASGNLIAFLKQAG